MGLKMEQVSNDYHVALLGVRWKEKEVWCMLRIEFNVINWD